MLLGERRERGRDRGREEVWGREGGEMERGSTD